MMRKKMIAANTRQIAVDAEAIANDPDEAFKTNHSYAITPLGYESNSCIL